MGVINHNAIIATTEINTEANKAWAWVESLPEQEAFKFARGLPQTNRFETIILVPDGSKEGWDESIAGANLRCKFRDYLKTRRMWNWVEVGFGEYGQKVLCGNNKNEYSDTEYHNTTED